MKSSIAKMTLVTAGLLLLSHCRHDEVVSDLDGGKVNNGPGPVGDILLCTSTNKSEKDHRYFLLRHTAALTLKQGALSSAKQPNDKSIFFYCTAPQPGAGDHTKNLWHCEESSESNNSWIINIFTDAKTKKPTAEIHQGKQSIGTMTCQDAK